MSIPRSSVVSSAWVAVNLELDDQPFVKSLQDVLKDADFQGLPSDTSVEGAFTAGMNFEPNLTLRFGFCRVGLTTPEVFTTLTIPLRKIRCAIEDIFAMAKETMSDVSSGEESEASLDLSKSTQAREITWSTVDGPFRRSASGWYLEPEKIDRLEFSVDKEDTAILCFDPCARAWISPRERQMCDFIRGSTRRILNDMRAVVDISISCPAKSNELRSFWESHSLNHTSSPYKDFYGQQRQDFRTVSFTDFHISFCPTSLPVKAVEIFSTAEQRDMTLLIGTMEEQLMLKQAQRELDNTTFEVHVLDPPVGHGLNGKLLAMKITGLDSQVKLPRFDEPCGFEVHVKGTIREMIEASEKRSADTPTPAIIKCRARRVRVPGRPPSSLYFRSDLARSMKASSKSRWIRQASPLLSAKLKQL